MHYRDIEVTFREVIVSIIILLVSIFIGTLITNAIKEAYIGKNDIYKTANILETESLFEHGMDTHAGYSFINGDVEPIGSVTLDEIEGDYVYIQKIKQKYVMKTRIVTYPCGTSKQPRTCTRTETYWEWDTVSRNDYHIDNYTINGYTVPWSEVEGFDETRAGSDIVADEIDGYPVKETLFGSDRWFEVKTGFLSARTRYGYYVVKMEDVEDGSIFVNFVDGEMEPGERIYDVYSDMTLEELQVHLEKDPKGFIVLNWVLTLGLTGGGIYLFVALDNDWLHGKKKYY